MSRAATFAATLAMLALACATRANAQTTSTTTVQAPTPTAGPASPRVLELGAFAHQVSDDLGDWLGVAARVVAGDRLGAWYLEAIGQEAFGDRGAYASVARRLSLPAAFTVMAGVGGGSGAFVFPDVRADLSVGRAWGPRRNVLTTVGGTVVNAKRGYRDQSFFASLAGYFPGGAVEAGVRTTRSDPGEVTSQRVFGALTLGREGHRLVVLRASGGEEGYQLLGLARAINAFSSDEQALAWREWVSPSTGLTLGVEHYRNPAYTRVGVTLGVFRHF